MDVCFEYPLVPFPKGPLGKARTRRSVTVPVFSVRSAGSTFSRRRVEADEVIGGGRGPFAQLDVIEPTSA